MLDGAGDADVHSGYLIINEFVGTSVDEKPCFAEHCITFKEETANRIAEKLKHQGRLRPSADGRDTMVQPWTHTRDLPPYVQMVIQKLARRDAGRDGDGGAPREMYFMTREPALAPVNVPKDTGFAIGFPRSPSGSPSFDSKASAARVLHGVLETIDVLDHRCCAQDLSPPNDDVLLLLLLLLLLPLLLPAEEVGETGVPAGFHVC